MYAEEFNNGCLYGKTGTGTDGNAWFTGFFEANGNKTYFAVYLDDTQQKDLISGNKAKEIAISLLRQYSSSSTISAISFTGFSSPSMTRLFFFA